MRRIARMAAASIVIVLGLALVSGAAMGAKSGTPIGRPEPPDDETVQAVPPFDPGSDRKAGIPKSLRPSSFDSEFGKRGKHKVEVQVIGGTQYAITWRDDPDTEWGTGSVQRSRTINSGFPVVQVGVNGATCIIKVDGREKDRQSSSASEPIVFCEA